MLLQVEPLLGRLPPAALLIVAFLKHEIIKHPSEHVVLVVPSLVDFSVNGIQYHPIDQLRDPLPLSLESVCSCPKDGPTVVPLHIYIYISS